MGSRVLRKGVRCTVIGRLVSTIKTLVFCVARINGTPQTQMLEKYRVLSRPAF